MGVSTATLWGMIAVLFVGAPDAGSPTRDPGARFVVRPDTEEVAVDHRRVSVRRPSDSLITRFQQDPAFNYTTNQEDSWWSELTRWIASWWPSLPQGADVDTEISWILELGFYTVLALIIGYATYMLVQLRSVARAPVRSSPSSVSTPASAEEMRTIDFQERLEAARAAGDTRRAVRFLYLQTLQRLDQAGIIAWRPSVTNRAYVDQLDADARSAFSELTRLFERIWYGGIDVEADRFERVQAQFETFWQHQDLPAPDPSGDPVSSSVSSSSY